MVEQTRVWQGRKTLQRPRPFISLCSHGSFPIFAISFAVFLCSCDTLGCWTHFAWFSCEEKRESFYLNELAFVFVQGAGLVWHVNLYFSLAEIDHRWKRTTRHQASKTQLDTHTGEDTRERRKGYRLLFFSFAGFEEGIRQLLTITPSPPDLNDKTTTSAKHVVFWPHSTSSNPDP